MGWRKDEVHTIGQNFASRITATLFHLTKYMLHAMSDNNNAGNISSIVLVLGLVLYLLNSLPLILTYISIVVVSAVKSYPDISSLQEFMDRKKKGSKGKKVQEWLESNLLAFDAAFTVYGREARWRKTWNRPTLLSTLENLFKSVRHYHDR